MQPSHLLLLDIDGLRPDVFLQALEAGSLPNLAALLGGARFERGIRVPIVAPAPSITFCSQACLVTGAHPRRHGIPGNQFFDRFGTYNNGVPRHFAFDVGDTLAADDAVRVFTDGLAADRLLVPTLFEKWRAAGRSSLVAGLMYARGAQEWIKPSLIKLARYTKGGNLFGMDSADYDRHVLEAVLDHLAAQAAPELLFMYFMGLDHESHKHGPDAAQRAYLVEQVEPMVGELWSALMKNLGDQTSVLCAVFSDHGQIRVKPDDQHSLRIGFPFDREMGHFFSALGLDVHDFPGEDPACDAVMALNGGLAHVYLQNQTGHWADPPDFERDVLPVGRAFWVAHQTGRYAAELHGALSGVFVRNVQQDGWEAEFQAVDAQGERVALEAWFAGQESDLWVDPVHRLNNLSGLYSGDLVLASNYADGYYFGKEITGVHGGLHPEDSLATLAFGWPGAPAAEWMQTRKRIQEAIERRCLAEGGRLASTCDLLTGLEAALQFAGQD